jgi:CCR4-NOT transcription complex subunit 1
VTVLHAIKPSRLPLFAFSWLELASHRFLMPKLLSAPNQQGWGLVQRLLSDLLRFLMPYLQRGEMTDSTRLMYRGTLRVLLVLLHDFPDFLCEYHYVLCDAIPTSCIQLRNLVLSAFPRQMRLPDPFAANVKVPSFSCCSPLVCYDGVRVVLLSAGRVARIGTSTTYSRLARCGSDLVDARD